MKNLISTLIVTSCLTLGTASAQMLVAPTGERPEVPPPAGRPSGSRPPMGPQMRIYHDLEYARVGDRALHLDLYIDERAKAPAPLVVWIHGGGWSKGDKFPTPASNLVKDGYAVASVEYRLSGEVKWPGQIYDCKAAIRFLRANAEKYNLDAAHIGAWGNSAGGHLVALLGTSGDFRELEGNEGNLDQSSRVQAVVDFYGPIDLMRMDATASKPKSNAPDLAEAFMIGGPLLENQGKVKAANPMTYIAKDNPPFLVVDGTADPVVPPQQGEFFVQALKQGGVNATMEYVYAAGHSINQVLTPEMTEEVTTFFDTNLRGGKRMRGDIADLGIPADSWMDPIQGDFGGTFYETFDTPSRGARTQASYRLYLPPDYQTNKTRRYPVIYYLHGLNDTSRKAVYVNYVQRADAAIRDGIMPPAIIICVQAPNHGMYVNSQDGKVPIESVLVKDLIAHVDSTYRTIPARDARAIEGHSMGGYGALHLAFKYPELFGTVTSYSAALIPIDKASANKEMMQSFGDLARYDAEYPETLVKKNAGRIRGRMNIRGMVGDQDNLMAVNRSFDAQLTNLQIAHEFYISKGAPHSIKEVLARLDFNPFAYYATVFSNAKIHPGSTH